MNKESKMYKLIKKYENNPVIRGLIQLIPFGSALDVSLMVTIQNIRSKRLEVFFDELSSGKSELTHELIKSEDFLHCYFATMKAVINTRRKEKIKLFARLLKSSVLSDFFSNTDEYEEYLSILDELSYNEIIILFILDDLYEKVDLSEITIDQKNPRAKRYFMSKHAWSDFENKLEKDLKIPKGEIESKLIRLSRSGCFEVDHNQLQYSMNLIGYLTPLYYRLKKVIRDKNI